MWRSKKLNGQEEDIISKYGAGFSATELSVMYDVNVSVIYNVIEKNGIIKRSTKAARNEDRYNQKRNDTIRIHFSESEIADIIEMYREGIGLFTISEKYQIDQSTVARVLTDKNIDIRDRAEQRKWRHVTNEIFKNTIIDRYGSFKKLAAMYKEKFIAKYGVSNPMQLPHIIDKQQKSALTIKEYTIDGVSFTYQGYELKAINYLLDNGYSIHDIKTSKKDVPNFRYYYNGNQHVYYPDLYVPKERRIIEVKSKYTFELEESINVAKKEAVLSAGYAFDFFIF